MTNYARRIIALLVFAACVVSGQAGVTLQGTDLTYQGVLKDVGNPVSGLYDFNFALFDSEVGGAQVGFNQFINDQPVSNGVFTVVLDFGVIPWGTGQERWLEIRVRPGASMDPLTILSPRQMLTAAPFSLATRGIVVDAGGQVGIGTSSPASTVDVRSDQSSPSLAIRTTGPSSALGSLLMLVNDDAAATIATTIDMFGDSATARISLRDDTSALTFSVPNGGERLRIGSNGNVGIGETLPLVRLHTRAASNTVALFDRTGSDGTIVGFLKDGAQQGSVSVAGSTVSYNAFTGSHFGWTDQPIERGAVVVMTGVNHRVDQADSSSEIIYGIARSAIANDSKCLGAYLGLENPAESFGPNNPHLVMAVGNGEMWVTESGAGDITPGDHLISSDVPGCAMKDDPQRFPIGYIVARAAEGVDWTTITPDYEGIKRTKISVLFESFIRNSEVQRLASTVHEQQREIESLKAQLQELQTLAERLARLEAWQVDGTIAAGHSNEGAMP